MRSVYISAAYIDFTSLKSNFWFRICIPNLSRYYYIPPVLFHTFLGIWKYYIHLLKCKLFFHLSYPCQLEGSTKLFMVAWKSHLLAKKFIWLTFCDHLEEVRLSVLPNAKRCLCIVLWQAIKIVMDRALKTWVQDMPSPSLYLPMIFTI